MKTDLLIRKVHMIAEDVLATGNMQVAERCRRAAVCAVIRNPLLSDADSADLTGLIDLSEELGAELAPRAVAALDGLVPRAYGKGAMVGQDGRAEHGAAMIHACLGRPMRIAAGGGPALIPGNCKVAAAGEAIDIPLGGLDDAWDCDAMDTMTVQVPGAPAPDEILLIMAYMAGPRPNARVPGADPDAVAGFVRSLRGEG